MGYHYMYNGKTGRKMPCKIFMVPNVYQRLGKFVENAQYAVYTGPRFAATQQPLQGKKHGGGLRAGEMEQATLVGHGTMNFLNEKLREDSDGCINYICARCRHPAIVNEQNSIYTCRTCGELADIRKVDSTFVGSQLGHMLNAVNLDIQYYLSN
jgi:DNA-directed RNA polymerase beta subunit